MHREPELYGYIPGAEPREHILLQEDGTSLALVSWTSTGASRNIVDIFSGERLRLDLSWLDSQFCVDPELRDLVIDLNLSGFRTFGCCRGKHKADEQGHLSAAYIEFKEYLPSDLLSDLRSAGLDVSNVQPEFIQKGPLLRNRKARVNAWIPNASTYGQPVSDDHIGLNVTFGSTVRRVFADRISLRSDDVRKLVLGSEHDLDDSSVG